MRGSAGLIGISALGPLLEACGGGGSSASTAAGTTVAGSSLKAAPKFAMLAPGSLPYMDVIQGFDANSYNVLRNGVEPLLKISPSGALGPGLATSFKQVDALTFVYELREGVEFWDGSALTPEDVIFSVQRSAGETSLVNYYWSTLKSATKTGPMEVTIKITQPTAFQPYIPAYAGLLVVSKKYAEKLGSKFGTPNGGTMGTGPYVIDSQWNADEGITLEANTSYWDKANEPLVRKVEYHVISDPSAALTAAQSGQVQGLLDPSPIEAGQWSHVGFSTISKPGLASVFFGFNTQMEPFDDVHARRAFAHCIDREGLASGVFKGGLEAATVITPPSQWAGMVSEAEARKNGAATMQYPFDVEAAKAELKKSKYPNGFTLECPVEPNRPYVLQTAEATAEALKQIGVDMSVKEISEEVYGENQANHEVPLQIVRYTADNNDPLNQQYYICFGKFAEKGQPNFANYKSAKMDKLLTTYDSTPIGSTKLKLANQVNELIQEDLPYAPVGWPDATILLKEGFGMKRWDGYTDTFGPLLNLLGAV
ncbi:MAG: ABC transporter substrate-binding protein [Solirubrobacterales bacterium]